jgi:hypothetical protein
MQLVINQLYHKVTPSKYAILMYKKKDMHKTEYVLHIQQIAAAITLSAINLH